jgi:hypothetical protein
MSLIHGLICLWLRLGSLGFWIVFYGFRFNIGIDF